MEPWLQEKLHMDMLTHSEGLYKTKDEKQVEGSFDDEAHDILFKLEDKSFWFKHRNKIIMEGVKKHNPKHNRIIEAGAGNGNTSYYLEQNGFSAAMFEPGERGCKNAVTRGNKNVVCALLDEKHVKINSIEAIGLFDVIEHIEDDIDFLKNLSKLLIDEGLLYITVPAHKILWSFSDNEANHFRRYNRKHICKAVSQSGYEVLYHTYFFWYLPILIFIFRTLPYWFKKNNKTREIKENANQREFVSPAFIDKILNWLVRGEIKRIKKGRRTILGASIFLVAKKR
jgi:SAM-dependent methyltransferase